MMEYLEKSKDRYVENYASEKKNGQWSPENIKNRFQKRKYILLGCVINDIYSHRI